MNYQPITQSHFTSLKWQAYRHYQHAAHDAVVALAAQELSKVCLSMPIAFIKNEDVFTCVAVQGFQPGENLWVDAQGRWLGTYVPAKYRGYPFALAHHAEAEQWVLCIDMDSGLVNAHATEVFFTDGQPSARLQEIMHFLQQVQASEQVLANMAAALAAESLLVPWTINIQQDAQTHAVQGLYRVDEAALNQCSAEVLKQLQQAGALSLAYLQLLSMQHLSTLTQLITHKAQQQQSAQTALPTTASGDLDLEFLTQGDTLKFGF